jgi:hypothetical protein
MRTPSWVIVVAAVVMAVPFGWGLGVLAAYLIAGPNFGQLPAATVPIGIVASIAFVLIPGFKPRTRLSVVTGGTVLFILLARLTG